MDFIETFFSHSTLNHWISQIIAMGITIFLIPRLWVNSIFGALSILIGISLINAFFWDANLFFSIPDTLSLAMIELLLINGLIFWLLVKFLPGIEVQGIMPALIAPLVFTVISMLLNSFGSGIDWINIITILFSYLVDLKNHYSGR